MPLGMQAGLGPGDLVLDGDPAPLPKKTVGWIKMPLGKEVGLGPGDTVLYGDPSPKKAGAQPPFSAHVYCGQTAGWIKMPLGMEVGLGPCDFVLDGDPALPSQEKRGHSRTFRPCLLWPNGWADQDVTWYEGPPRSRSHFVR